MTTAVPATVSDYLPKLIEAMETMRTSLARVRAVGVPEDLLAELVAHLAALEGHFDQVLALAALQENLEKFSTLADQAARAVARAAEAGAGQASD